MIFVIVDLTGISIIDFHSSTVRNGIIRDAGYFTGSIQEGYPGRKHSLDYLIRIRDIK